MKRGVTEEDISTWTDNIDEANQDANGVDPNLVALEVEQMRKRTRKYSLKELGNLSTNKPNAHRRFMLTQLT